MWPDPPEPRGGRQVEGLDRTLEIYALVGAVAKRFVFRIAAAAEANFRAAAEAEGFAVLIENLKITFDADGAIGANRDGGSCHESSWICGYIQE